MALFFHAFEVDHLGLSPTSTGGVAPGTVSQVGQGEAGLCGERAWGVGAGRHAGLRDYTGAGLS